MTALGQNVFAMFESDLALIIW